MNNVYMYNVYKYIYINNCFRNLPQQLRQNQQSYDEMCGGMQIASITIYDISDTCHKWYT